MNNLTAQKLVSHDLVAEKNARSIFLLKSIIFRNLAEENFRIEDVWIVKKRRRKLTKYFTIT